MARKAKQYYPKMVYGPGGQQRIIQKDEQMPPGFAEHPSLLEAAATDTGSGEDPNKGLILVGGRMRTKEEAEERAGILQSLREVGVELDDEATDEEINAAVDELTKHDPDGEKV